MKDTLKQANKILGTKYKTWGDLWLKGTVSEEFIETFHRKVGWMRISQSQRLSEHFIEKFRDKLDWDFVCPCQILSEAFMEKFQDKLVWESISAFQVLSEAFMEKFQDKLVWESISGFQVLSEAFMEKFQDKICWKSISKHQRLSEPFIEKFQQQVIWESICKFQPLSEKFIEKFRTNIQLDFVSKYQKVSSEFVNKHNISIPEDCWLHKSVEFKRQQILQTKKYILEDDYIIAYKGIRSDNYSVYSFLYQYFVGETYTSQCDCSIDIENSFGLSAWTLKDAKRYCNQKIIKVKIHLNDLGCIVRGENKLRCFKFTVVE